MKYSDCLNTRYARMSKYQNYRNYQIAKYVKMTKKNQISKNLNYQKCLNAENITLPELSKKKFPKFPYTRNGKIT